MPRYSTEQMIGVGDVLVTREGPWYVSGAIRLGAALAKLPAFTNHAIIVHHQDEQGVMWGIEGRPGGVGWRDLSGPLSWTLTNANNLQPKTEDQRYLIAVAAETLLGTAYDWAAIAEHTREALRLWKVAPRLAEWKDDEIPAHVVCSSFADWAYERVGLPNPGGNKLTRMTAPGDWDKFMLDNRSTWEIQSGKN